MCHEFYIFYFRVFSYDPEVNYIQGISGCLEAYVNTAKSAKQKLQKLLKNNSSVVLRSLTEEPPHIIIRKSIGNQYKSMIILSRSKPPKIYGQKIELEIFEK